MALYLTRPYINQTPRRNIRSFSNGNSLSEYQPVVPVDVMETENEYVLSAQIPGVNIEDIDIQIERNILQLKGEIFKKVEENDKYLIEERRYGKFERKFKFQTPVDPEKIEASLKNGILTIAIPKPEVEKPRTIAVKSA